MSGALNAPLLAPDKAGLLLDEVIYERVLAFIDLDGLFQFEQELWTAFDECGFSEEDVPDLVKALIDKALHRVPDDPRRYSDLPSFGPAEPFGDCELCEAEARMRAKLAKSG